MIKSKKILAFLVLFSILVGIGCISPAVANVVDPISVNVGIYDYTASDIGAENASESGVVLAETTVSVDAGATALDAIKAALTAGGIQYHITESEYGDYIDSVNNLGAAIAGYTQSGWMFSINDNFGNMGAGSTTVSANDVLEMHYSLVGWGADVGSYWNGGPTITAFKLAGVSGTVVTDGHTGQEANPYEICVLLPAETELTALSAEIETSLHSEYRNFSIDVTSPQDYSSGLTFKLFTDGDFCKTWYTVNTVETGAETSTTFAVTPADAVLKVYNTSGAAVVLDMGTTRYSGLHSGDNFTYNVSKYGYISKQGSFTAGANTAVTVALTPAGAPAVALPDYTGDWISFRGNEQNMGITGSATPKIPDQAVIKWAKKHSGGWAESITPPILVNDYLYIAKGKTVAKIDKASGEIVATSPEMAGAVGFALNPITYGEGMLFVPVGLGRVQALRADTLELLWVSEKVGGQTVTPVTYKDGYIYIGTWNRENTKGTYYCLSVTDEDTTSSTETKYCTWRLDHTGGFYWAGAYAADNYVIFGSDDGSPEDTYTETAVLYSADPTTGIIIDTITGIKGDIRSTVSYDAGSDRIYFTTKGGQFYKVKVNSDGTFDDAATQVLALGGMSTGTPLVYNGRAYVGVAGSSQFGTSGHKYKVVNVTDMSEIYSVDVPGYIQTSALLSTACVNETGKVYVYLTYNAMPGGIFVLEDSAGQSEGKGYHLFTPVSPMSNYCICSLVCDAEGTIYYKNDSGYLMAVAKNTAWATGITVIGGNAVMPEFKSSTTEYEVTVDRGTKSVTVTPTVNTGATVTVNNIAGSAEVALNDGKASVTVTVTNGSDTRTYTLSIRERSNDATLAVLYGSSSNSPDSSLFSMNPSFVPNTLSYTVSGVTESLTFVRLWLKASDPDASVLVKAVSGVEDKTAGDVIDVTSVHASTGQNRYALYYSTEPVSDTIIVDVIVTAEDGATANIYRVTLTKKVAQNPDNGGGTQEPTPSDTIFTTLTNNMTQRGSRLTFDVWAYNAGGNKINSTVKLNGSNIPYTWDDAEKTSYTLNFTQSGENTVVITAGETSKTYKINYVPAQNGEKIGQATVAVEAFTIGGGYIIEPVKVDILEGKNTAQLLEGLLNEKGYSYDKTGTVTNGFYLAGIAGSSLSALPTDGSRIPSVLLDHIGTVDTRSNPNWLGEFDFTNGSGWMYCVNNIYPNVGFSDYYLSDGDVMRIQFTLALGADIGGSGATGGGSDFYCVADKDRLVALLAEYGCAKVPKTVLDTMMKLNATASEVSSAISTLTTGGGTPSGGTSAGMTDGTAVEDTNEIIIPEAKIQNGVATSTVTTAEVSTAVKAAKKSGAASIVIETKTKGDAERVNLNLPAASIAEIIKESGAAIAVKTEIGEISISNKALSKIAEQGGSSVSVGIERLDNSALSAENRAIVGDHPVLDLSIEIDGKRVTNFGKGIVTVSLPYVPKAGEDTSRLKVYYIDGNGKAAEMPGTHYDANTGCIVFTTDHFSIFAVVYDKNKITFTDVAQSDWFYDEVSFAVEKGLFNGTSGTAFSPDGSMSRAMAVTVLHRLDGKPAGAAADKFADIQSGIWYSSAVDWADGNGIVSGCGNGLFGTNDSMTREALAAILYRYAKYKGYDVTAASALSFFKDEDLVSGWAREAMSWAVGTGLIGGTDNNTLDPVGTATRAQTAAILKRFAENLMK